MSIVAITGGTGHLGQEIVRLLMQDGHEVRVLARSPGPKHGVTWVRGDLATGEGVEKTVAGADVVIHAATHSPAARRGYLLPIDLVRTPRDVDVEGTQRVLAAAEASGVGHFMHVSIVGLDKVHLPYAAAKRAAEELVRSSTLPWSIVAATSFYWLWDRMFTKQLRLPVWVMPSLSVEPVDSDDFATYVVECLNEGPGGDRADFSGPERLTLDQLGRDYLDCRGIRRRLFRVPVPARLAEVAGGLPTGEVRRGTTTWAQWLGGRY
jgi:uncharacterized protein YbjT (DUF2867 family)